MSRVWVIQHGSEGQAVGISFSPSSSTPGCPNHRLPTICLDTRRNTLQMETVETKTRIPASQTRVRVVIATSVMLSFISFWRAAAIVLNDLGSSAFYVGGIAEDAVGKSAPWFILAVMLFSYAVRALYIESS